MAYSKRRNIQNDIMTIIKEGEQLITKWKSIHESSIQGILYLSSVILPFCYSHECIYHQKLIAQALNKPYVPQKPYDSYFKNIYSFKIKKNGVENSNIKKELSNLKNKNSLVDWGEIATYKIGQKSWPYYHTSKQYYSWKEQKNSIRQSMRQNSFQSTVGLIYNISLVNRDMSIDKIIYEVIVRDPQYIKHKRDGLEILDLSEDNLTCKCIKKCRDLIYKEDKKINCPDPLGFMSHSPFMILNLYFSRIGKLIKKGCIFDESKFFSRYK